MNQTPISGESSRWLQKSMGHLGERTSPGQPDVSLSRSLERARAEDTGLAIAETCQQQEKEPTERGS